MGSSLLPVCYAQIKDCQKEFTRSSVEEEATVAGRSRGGALQEGWLAGGMASTLDSSPQPWLERGLFSRIAKAQVLAFC